MAQEANRRLLARAELVIVHQVHRIPEADDGVELGGKLLEVGDRLHADRRRARRDNSAGRGGGRESSGSEGRDGQHEF